MARLPMRSWKTHAVREIGVFALFVLLAVVFTWPLAADLDTTVSDPGDPLLNAWIIDWVCHALTHGPLGLYTPTIFHGSLYPLAYSENMVGIALAVLPFDLAGVGPITLYNVAMLLGFAFAGYGAFVLARVITGNALASIVAGVFFAFAPFKFIHLAHVQIIWSGWLPMLLAALLAWWREPSPRRAVLLFGAFVMNGLTNIHWLLYGGFALAVSIGFLAFADPRRDGRFWRVLIASLILSGLVLLPFLMPYSIVAEEYGMRRTSGESRGGSATLADWLSPPANSFVYGRLPVPRHAERELFPGVVVLLLAGFAAAKLPGPRTADSSWRLHAKNLLLAMAAVLVVLLTPPGKRDIAVCLVLVVAIYIFREPLRDAVRRSRFSAPALTAALWMLIGFLASFGENGFLHPILFRLIPPFRATRTPARWAILVLVGLSVWAALGVCKLMARSKRPRLVALVAILLLSVDIFPRIRWEHVPSDVAPVYRWMADARPGVTLELPIHAGGWPSKYVIAAATHHRPIINGVSGWEPPLHERLRKKEEALQYDDELLAHSDTLVVHNALLRDGERDALSAWIRQSVARGKLTPWQRFGDDDVYRVQGVATRER